MACSSAAAFVVTIVAKDFAVNFLLKYTNAVVKTFTEMISMMVIFLFEMWRGKYEMDEKSLAGFITVFAIVFASAAYSINEQAETALGIRFKQK